MTPFRLGPLARWSGAETSDPAVKWALRRAVNQPDRARGRSARPSLTAAEANGLGIPIVSIVGPHRAHIWRASCEDPPVTVLLEHCDRRFQVMPYHDAIRHDGPAVELAELINGELGPALVTVLFAEDDVSAGGAEAHWWTAACRCRYWQRSWSKSCENSVAYVSWGAPRARRNDAR